jgi:rubrerythrin
MDSSLGGGNLNNSMFGGVVVGGGGGGGGMGYSPIKFYCMNCGYEHKESACPKCASRAVRAG